MEPLGILTLWFLEGNQERYHTQLSAFLLCGCPTNIGVAEFFLLTAVQSSCTTGFFLNLPLYTQYYVQRAPELFCTERRVVSA